MNQVRSNPLGAAIQELHRILETAFRARQSQWASDVHVVLGQLAAAIQDEVQTSQKSMKMVGEINPDFQNTPVADRHCETRREELIDLGEQVHQLRAEIRRDTERGVIDVPQIRSRGVELQNALEEVCRVDDAFVQTALNTNLGSGE